MTAYYNEHDPYAAEWLRRLILNGHIAPGDVDESDIRDIRPDDLKGYTQCHFFAGIGVWSHALRRAGWPDDRPIWTGSCPCQPFSAAGARAGFADERHLWPAFNHLIEQCQPPVVAGEQVENAGDWLDLVSADLEAQGYAFGAAFLPAAGFGGAHIRSRNYWVAYAQHAERWPVHVNRQDGRDRENDRRPQAHSVAGTCGEVHGLADAGDERRQQERRGALGDEEAHGRTGRNGVEPHRDNIVASDGADSGLDDGRRTSAPMLGRNPVDWLFCRDGKWRPVGPGTFPLVDAAPARVGRLRAIDTQSPSRVGRLRAYGNALDAETAVNFLIACRDTIDAANT